MSKNCLHGLWMTGMTPYELKKDKHMFSFEYLLHCLTFSGKLIFFDIFGKSCLKKFSNGEADLFVNNKIYLFYFDRRSFRKSVTSRILLQIGIME